MDGELQVSEREAAAEMLGWWLEAGVDVAVGEAPRDWLRPPPERTTTPSQAAIGTPESMPDDLAAFRLWLAGAPGLPLDRAGARRVLPHGQVGAEIMLLSEMPSLEDGTRPIGADAWALTVKMLSAIGIDAEAAYSASLACFQLPGAKLKPAELERCGEIARRHIALAAPRRLVLFGDAPARALLGESLAAARGKVHKVEGVRTIATLHPRWLMQRPGDKALAWRDLLLLMEEEI